MLAGTLLASKVIYVSHRRAMHWRIKLKIVAIREYYWIPKLQQIVDSVIRKSSKRERFHTKPFATQ